MYKILKLFAREILDSRGIPTVEVDIKIVDDKWKVWIWRASVPSWASTGKHEALELRDWDKNRYNGRGVLNAVSNVNIVIWQNIKEKEFKSFRDLDRFLIDLDATENKSKLGANAILAVSIAFIKSCACLEWKEVYEFLGDWDFVMPKAMFNILNWGQHADNELDIQEFMIVPVWFENFHESVRAWEEVFASLKTLLSKKNYSLAVWDEWWFAPKISKSFEALDFLVAAIVKAWYTTEQVKLSLDVAATEFMDWGESYVFEWEIKSAQDMIEFYYELMKKYPFISIEDWIGEDIFEDWADLNGKLWDKIMLVWDDLLVTNIDRLRQSIDKNLCNSVLVKPNQIWTISETIDFVNMAKDADMKIIVSHRSGETEDTFIADFAVAIWADFVKFWSFSRSERLAKYNQLLRIEEKTLR